MTENQKTNEGGETNTTKSQEAVNPENPVNSGKSQEIQRDDKGRFLPGVSGNPNGPEPGYKQFDTIFEEAIKEIVKSKKLPIKDPEKEMMIKGIIEALKGNHNFWKSLAEFRYGKPKETKDINLKTLNINQLLDDLNSGIFPKIEE